MTIDQDLRMMLRERADGVAAAPVVPDSTVRRVRTRKTLMAGGALAAAAVVALTGAFVLRSTVWTDAAPLPPADDTKEEIGPMRNGRIIKTGDGTAPEWRTVVGDAGWDEWQAFDQDTGSFLYAEGVNLDSDRVTVVRHGGPVAEFDCPPSASCHSVVTFGPGPDEVTVPADRSVQVIAFDGTVRDTLDIPIVVTQDQGGLEDLAWSPDGSRLAISTEPDCDLSSDPCEARVWILDRDGGEPQLVFTESAPDDLVEGRFRNVPGFPELAWSPDGRSLSVLVTSLFLEDNANNGVWPRLVALRLQPGQPVRAETLHVYDDVEVPAWNLAGHEKLFFANAWSPDGTRIAVTSKDGIAEISAEDGQVLTLHPHKDPTGLLAWLPERSAPVPPADETGQEIEQMATIRQMADALNARDIDAFIDLFAREGKFNPRGDFDGDASLFEKTVPIADAELVRAWMAINEAWDLKADVVACDVMTGPIRQIFDRGDVHIECEVRARWHNLSLEIIENWNFEFDGTELLAWDLSKPASLNELLELNPPDRILPLGYDGLEAWEEWLKANHPEDAARYLNPRISGPPEDCLDDSCQEWWDSVGSRFAPLLENAKENWSINGFLFWPDGLIPYDPEFADEIEASIQAYLDGR